MSKKKSIKDNKIYLSVLLVVSLFMSIGYATISSVTLDITGKTNAKTQDGIFITEVNYKNGTNVNKENSKIISAYQTNLNSSISLNKNSNSSITYEVTIYNSYDIDYVFERIKYQQCNDDENCNTYSNSNIQITPSIEKGQIINANNFLTFDITFSYIDTENITSTTLDSYIKFFFTENVKNYLIKGTDLNAKIKDASSTSVNDTTVTKVIFGYYDDYSDKFNWDNYDEIVDIEQTGSIRLFRTETSSDTIVYILSKGKIFAHANSARSFQTLRAMEEIIFNNYDTSQIEDMTRMFYMFNDETLDYDAVLKRLDLSNWDTFNVKNMRAMFGYNIELEYLNISTWDTKNCTNMGYMFQELRSLPNLNIKNFDTSNVETMQGMFMGFTGAESLDLSSFDTSNTTNMTQMFNADSYHTALEYTTSLKTIYVSNKFTINNIENKDAEMFEKQTKLIGGNGTKYDKNNITVNYAIVDQAAYDSSGNYISGNKGYFTLK